MEEDESENDSDSTGSNEEDNDGEVWKDVPEDLFEQDVLSASPLPDPQPKQTKLQAVNSTVQWLAYFLLIWQSLCHISDNGLAWLLQFLLQFLKVINAYAPTDTLNELSIIFPTSIYMIRKLLAVDRDSFTKFVVCPKCTKCYQYDECVKNVDGRHVVKRCSSKFYTRGKVCVCDAQLVKKVTLKNNTVKYYPIFYYCYNSIINSLEKLVQRKGFAEKCEKWG